MKVGLLQEGDLTHADVATRYHQMIDEVVLADTLGFSTWGTSEQHFSPPHFSVSAPEVLYAAIASRTSAIKLRVMAAVLLAWNHPILVAERLATLDIVSRGRAEICTARSNNLRTLEAFGVDPADTRAQWADSMDVLLKALTDEYLEHDGPVWKIPRRELVPRPVTTPHPPVSVAATSEQSHTAAGERGLGVIGFDNYFGFAYLQSCIDAYRTAFDAADHADVAAPNPRYGLYVGTAYCAESREEARRVVRDVALAYFDMTVDLYVPLARNPAYAYLDQVAALVEHRGDLDRLCESTPAVMIGDPDDFVERIRRLEAMGVDEVLLRIDGVGHERVQESLRLIGHEVIPVVDTATEGRAA